MPVAETQSQTMDDQQDAGFQVVQRVTSLPLVTSAVSVYDLAKTNSPLLARSFGAAEAAVRFAMAGANPIISQFEKPLEYVDKMACHGLDALETKVPAIKQEPAEIIQLTKGYFDQWRGYGEGKVQGSLIYGIDQMDAGLNAADTMVDKILPAVEGESPPDATEGFQALESMTEEARGKVRKGSDAIRHMSVQGMEFDKLPLTVRNLAQSLVDSLNHMIDFVQRFIPSLDQTNQLDKAREYATEIYAHLTNSGLATNGLNGLKKVTDQISQLQDILNTFFTNAFNNSGVSRFLPPSVTAYAASLTNGSAPSGEQNEMVDLNPNGERNGHGEEMEEH